jgi:hypothetical protein
MFNYIKRHSSSIHVPEVICMVMGHHVHIESSLVCCGFCYVSAILHTVTWISDLRWGLN